MMVDTASPNPRQFSEADQTAIEQQLDRLLSNRHFSHSRRFPAFLRFVVRSTLTGHAVELKERTLGIEIFGRATDYDTSSDPIVRVTAAEIRKRIAQYYQEPGHEEELRISLQAGSYVPQFHWPQHDAAVAGAAEASAEPIGEPTLTHGMQAIMVPRRQRSWAVTAGVALVILLAASALFAWRATHHSPLQLFWSPILSDSDPVLFCMADQNMTSVIALRDAIDPTKTVIMSGSLSAVVMDDLTPLVKVVGILQGHGKRFSIKGSDATNLVDLRNGPTIFVGAFDNAWTLRQTRPLRYHFANNAGLTEMWIVDSSSNKPTGWHVDRPKLESVNNYRDYAIVARFTDSTTGKLSVIAAGIGRGGTAAAGDFMSDPDQLAQLAGAAGLQANRGKQNVEVVLSTQIIDGQPGTPQIESVYYW